MKIHSEDVLGFSIELYAAMGREMQWFAYDSSLESVTARDIDVFATEKEANEFKAEKEKFGESFQVLPIDAVSRNIDELIINELHENESYPDVHLDVEEVLDIQERLNFDYTAERLDELMQSFDWSTVFYDPLEANTEAETNADKNELRRLESVLDQLQVMYRRGDAGKQLVEDMVHVYWSGKPMEIQKYELFKDSYELKINIDPALLRGTNHAVAIEVLDAVELALSKGEHWMAYNEFQYFIGAHDVHFFDNEDAAYEFSANNISDQDNFHVMEIHSVSDLLAKIPYEENIKNNSKIQPNDQSIQSIQNNKINLMNENNSAYLKDNIKYTGFGEALFPELERNLKEGKPEFQLPFKTEIGSRPFEAILDFKKGNGDMYFYNGYKASVERSNGQCMEQYFKIEKGKGVHGKEAFNLLQGKAVVDRQKIQHLDKEARENLEVKPWMQLDFEKPTAKGFEFHPYSEGYGYNLKDALNKFPVLEMDGGKSEKDLLRSLEKGNAQSVTMEINGKPEKFFMEANPARKTINVYDSGFHLMKHQELPLKQEQAPKQETSQENKQSNGKDQKQGNAKTNSQKNGRGVNHKKKTGKEKGLTIQ